MPQLGVAEVVFKPRFDCLSSIPPAPTQAARDPRAGLCWILSGRGALACPPPPGISEPGFARCQNASVGARHEPHMSLPGFLPTNQASLVFKIVRAVPAGMHVYIAVTEPASSPSTARSGQMLIERNRKVAGASAHAQWPQQPPPPWRADLCSTEPMTYSRSAPPPPPHL